MLEREGKIDRDKEKYELKRRAVVVAKSVERFLPTLEDPGSNPDIGKFYKESLLAFNS